MSHASKMQQIIESAFFHGTESATTASNVDTPPVSLTLDAIQSAVDSITYYILYADSVQQERGKTAVLCGQFNQRTLPPVLIAHPDDIRMMKAKLSKDSPLVRMVRAGLQREGMRIIDPVEFFATGRIVEAS